MEPFLIFLFGLITGLAFGLCWRRTVNLQIDQDMLDAMEAGMVNEWLDQKGLVWMPKGANFEYRETKRG